MGLIKPMQKLKLALLLFLLAVTLYQLGCIGFYNGLNKGIYIFNCGLEFVGDPGFFCGNY